MAFSNNLRYLRKKYDMSQEDLANKLGYKSFTTIQKWESGVSEPSVSTVKKIAEIFGVTIDQITNDDLSDTEHHYYIDPEAAEIAQAVQQRPELKILFDFCLINILLNSVATLLELLLKLLRSRILVNRLS